MAFLSFIKKNVVLFKKSITLKEYLFSLAVDFVSFLIFLSVLVGFYFSVMSMFTNLDSLMSSVSDPSQLSPNIAASIRTVSFLIILVAVLFLAISLFVISSSRLFLWIKLNKSKSPSERITKKMVRYLKHYLVNLALFGVFVGIPVVALFANQQELIQSISTPERVRALTIMLSVVFFFYLHFGFIFNHLFSKTSRVFYSLRNVFEVGFMQIGYYAVPYIMVGLSFYAVSYLLFLLRYISFVALVVGHIFFIIAIVPVYRLFIYKLTLVLCKKYATKVNS